LTIEWTPIRANVALPKQEYTAEFKELAVKRVRNGRRIAAVMRESGLVADAG
jgi:hypothetical protein